MNTGHIVGHLSGGVPEYCSLKTGRSLGVGVNGWVQDANAATHFLRQKDAQEFIDACLPQAHNLHIFPHQVE